MMGDESLEAVEPELYSSSDVARIFRVDVKTVSRWADRGEFERRGVKVHHTIGGHRRYAKEEIHKLFQLMLDGKLYEDDEAGPGKASRISRVDCISPQDSDNPKPE